MSSPSLTGPVDLLVVGAQKAGTTTLWGVLRQQEWFVPAHVKELHHFSSESLAPDAAYRSRFDPKRRPDQLRGEATPDYLSSYGAPARIRAHNPDVRLVVLLRDPIDRARSAFHHARRHGQVGRHADFEDVYLSEARRRVTEPAWTRIRWDGMYARHLERYLEHFPREQLHVLFFEELVTEPEPTIAELWKSLGQDVTVGTHLPHLNPGRDAALPTLELALAYLANRPMRRDWRTARRALRVLRRVQNSALDPSGLDDRTVARLVDDYGAEVERLGTLLGRRPPWPRFTATDATTITRLPASETR